MTDMWERREGDALRQAIIRKARNGARARLLELGQVPVRPEPEPEPMPVNVKPTAEQLADLLDARDNVQWREGVGAILKAFGESHRRLVSNHRDTHIVICRTAVAQYLRNRGWSYPRIGQFMQRDHSSIVHLLNPDTRQKRYVKVQEMNRLAEVALAMEEASQ